MRSCDILILGSGITACAAALSMHESGHKEVWLVSPTWIGDDTSALSPALLHGYHELAAMTDLSSPAPQVFGRWAEEAHEEIGLQRPGMLVVADQDLAPRVLGRALRLRPRGMEAEEVDEDGLAKHEARGRYPENGAGLWIENASQLDPRKTIDVLARLAGRKGIRVIQGEKIHHLLRDDDHVLGIETSHGSIHAAWTILASDAMVQALVPELARHGLRICQRPYDLLQPPSDFGGEIPILWHERTGVTWRSISGEWIRRNGCTRETVGEGDPLLPALQRATSWGRGNWESTRGKDSRPLVGPLPGAMGALVSCGFGPRDFDFAPISGSFLRQWTEHSQSPGGMASVLDPRRFVAVLQNPDESAPPV